jgi:two-component system OmpR family sensor kinase
MIETIRGRLTLWYVSVLAAVLVLVSALIYVLLARALEDRVDENLRVVLEIAATSLANDLGEGQDMTDAARSTASELSSSDQMVAIFDGDGNLLADSGREADLPIGLPGMAAISDDEPVLYTVSETDEADDRHRLAVRRLTVSAAKVRYIVMVGNSLDATDDELGDLREILAWVVPVGLLIAGLGGWFLARKSLAPVVAMAEQARRIGVGGVDGRLPVANPRDELGRLAATFNELLDRLGASMAQQRQFMADASHELRTPVATARTAAGVALQRPHRGEEEYRDSLEIIEQQTARLSRIVDDMFMLARADAGNFPIRKTPMYLDEVLDEVVRATRVLSRARQVEVRLKSEEGAAMTGDEEMIKRMIVNVLDNAVRHAPSGSAVEVQLTRAAGRYEMAITDTGPGIPDAAQPHIFERFYRADPARSRANDSGAGLGLALARWIARAHDGDVWLLRSSSQGTTFMMAVGPGGGDT